MLPMHAVAALSMLAGHGMDQANQHKPNPSPPRLTTLFGDATTTPALLEDPVSGNPQEWSLLDFLTTFLCVYVNCNGGDFSSAFHEDVDPESVKSRMIHQIGSYAVQGATPGLTETEKQEGVTVAVDTRDLILANPGLLTQQLADDYLFMLDDLIKDLGE
jgi:hypothetical protein